jgi:hypothetical protein
MFGFFNLKFHPPIRIRFFEKFSKYLKEFGREMKIFSFYALLAFTVCRYFVVEKIKVKVLACSLNCLLILKMLSFTLSSDPKAAIITLKMLSGRRPCSCQTIPKAACDN